MRWRFNEPAKLAIFFLYFFFYVGQERLVDTPTAMDTRWKGVEGSLEDALYNFFTETTSILRAKERQIKSSTSMHK